MIVTLTVRVTPEGDPHFATHSGTAHDCIFWLSGFLTAGIIVDKMVVMGR